MYKNLSYVASTATRKKSKGELVYGSKPLPNLSRKDDNVCMAGERPSVYTNTNSEPPGSVIFYVRDKILDMSQRKFGENCNPPIDHTTIQRIEKGGETRTDTLKNIAATFSRLLGKEVTLSDLFLPEELKGYAALDHNAKAHIRQTIKWASEGINANSDNISRINSSS